MGLTVTVIDYQDPARWLVPVFPLRFSAVFNWSQLSDFLSTDLKRGLSSTALPIHWYLPTTSGRTVPTIWTKSTTSAHIIFQISIKRLLFLTITALVSGPSKRDASNNADSNLRRLGTKY